MTPDGSVEQGLLQARINELDRRLARLERQMNEASLEAAPAEIVPAADAAPADTVPAKADQAVPDEGREGARMVAIQLLTSGYAREEVTAYLSTTFGIADAEAVLADAGLVPG